MKFVTTNPLFVDLIIGNLDPRRVALGIEQRFHAQPGSRSRLPNQVDHGLQVPKRLPLPGQTDEREDPMLNAVPFPGFMQLTA